MIPSKAVLKTKCFVDFKFFLHTDVLGLRAKITEVGLFLENDKTM